MAKNALYIQSGGPTAVINSSAYGVIVAARKYSNEIGKLFGVKYGIVGLIKGELIDINAQEDDELERLMQTPSMAFGSCRYRISDTDDADYNKILSVLKENQIRYIFFNGGNGTARACLSLDQFLKRKGYDCQVVMIPKTVDNDVWGIDHSPGYPSTARHIAISVSELSHDLHTYDTGLILVVEVMGRDTGWLVAASKLAGKDGHGPDLIYVPEVGFSVDKFLTDIKKVYEEKGKCMVVVAEGVKDDNGKYLFEYTSDGNMDPRLNMGGITPYLTSVLRENFDCKIRGVDLSLMQRCAIHTASDIDIHEAYELGVKGVEFALAGESGKMVTLQRTSSQPYQSEITVLPIEKVASQEYNLPLHYITENGNNIDESFYEYIEPLVGELPVYAKIKL